MLRSIRTAIEFEKECKGGQDKNQNSKKFNLPELFTLVEMVDV
jgi:hypothetical protein